MTLKARLLQLHRWMALIFALPLLVVIGTGFFLSFEPILATQPAPAGSLSPAKFAALIEKFDPAGKARGLDIDARLGVLTLSGVGPDGEVDIDLASGEEADVDSALGNFFAANRRLHRSLVFRMNWLVTASSFAMLALAAMGLGMGFSRLRNTLGGWHKAAAWSVFPLVALSPLTGLFLAYNVNIGPGPGGPPQGGGGRGAREAIKLIDAARLTAAQFDPATIASLGPRGGRMLARVVENGEIHAYAVSAQSVVAQPRNWTRALHVGDGLWTGALNVIASAAMLILLVTGVSIWGRREWRRQAIRRARAGAVPAE